LVRKSGRMPRWQLAAHAAPGFPLYPAFGGDAAAIPYAISAILEG